MDALQSKKRKVEIMQLELNVLKLETRLLEMDEEKIKVAENIEEQKLKLDELKNLEKVI